MKLRPFQQEIKRQVRQSWDTGHRCPIMVMPTGSGKTTTFCSIVHDTDEPALVMAHRQELVAQMSVTLGRYKIRHRIIAPDATRKTIERLHMEEFGRRWVDQSAPVAAGGVDTLIRKDASDKFLRSVKLWVPDEFHHVLRENKWGKAIALMPANSRGLGPTATPVRADGKGLGAHAHGVADDLIVGPSMRESIRDGMLCDYKIFAPPSTLNLADVGVGADGEYKHDPLSKAVRQSSITGDVVRSYLKIAPGKLGITFAVDLAHAQELVDAYNAAGVPAALLSGETDPLTRARVMREFRPDGKWLQLVNVDVLGEGVDVPACEVVSFARPTMSFGLYVQQFGRVLRLMLAPGMADGWGDLTRAERLRRIAASSKPRGIIIDHVGQWERHGLPDSPRRWTLDARERGTKSGPSDAIPLRTCLNDASGDLCLTVFERTEPCCPACGWVPPITNRSRPEFVDGDLFELDADILAKLRGESERLLAPEPCIPHGMPTAAAHGLLKQHRLRRDAQIELGEAIELWAGWQLHQGHDHRAAYKRFFFAFGVDVATARTLGRPDAEKLCADIQQVLDLHHVVKG